MPLPHNIHAAQCGSCRGSLGVTATGERCRVLLLLVVVVVKKTLAAAASAFAGRLDGPPLLGRRF